MNFLCVPAYDLLHIFYFLNVKTNTYTDTIWAKKKNFCFDFYFLLFIIYFFLIKFLMSRMTPGCALHNPPPRFLKTSLLNCYSGKCDCVCVFMRELWCEWPFLWHNVYCTTKKWGFTSNIASWNSYNTPNSPSHLHRFRMLWSLIFFFLMIFSFSFFF